jgi:chromosome segregation protein
MAGFKSFAEAAKIDIESGLTGIVGPNGCGKSNIVEGLRWVMGESSARQMRGGEMDDVIFAGTEQRPARNLAEITLELDNRKRNAPAEFNNSDDIEITRKIERGKGSSYYVNAKLARARDIQLLFADVASGARSSGIVSQGRIGAIVGAKPTERRALLEEAANIRGLHARRHEAELRLRSAESNLERLDDVIAGLIEQRDSLKKQARQAARYRSVADRIRKAEAQLLLASWSVATTELTTADTDLKQAKSAVEDRTQLAAKSATARAEISASLPPLRQAEAKRAAAYQRLSIARDELDREEERLQQAIQQLANRQAQLRADITRETGLRDDANTAIQQLNDEVRQLADEIAEATPQQAETAQNLEVARTSATLADTALADASATLRAAANTRAALANRQNDIIARQATANASLAGLAANELAKQAEAAATEEIAAEADFRTVHKALETADTELTAATVAAEAAETARRDSAAQIARIQAEIDALQYLLSDQDDGETRPVIDQLSVRDGMETALAAYLADELSLPVGGGRRGYWQSAPQKTDLEPPVGTTALAGYVSGVPALTTALAGVGVIEDPAHAETLQARLCPGQAITSKDGSLWRWDGFVRLAPMANKSAERIHQRQRLDQLQSELIVSSKKAEKDQNNAQLTQDTLAQCQTKLNDCRAASLAAEKKYGEMRRQAESDSLKAEAAQIRAAELTQTLHELATSLADCEAEIASLGDDAALSATETSTRQTAETAREALTAAMQNQSRLVETIKNAENRRRTCDQEANAWQVRLNGATGRIAELENRLADSAQEQQRLDDLPSSIANRRMEIGDQLEQAENARQEAADALRFAENKLAEAETLQREADTALARAREIQIRAEGHQERCTTRLTDLEARTFEKLHCAADAVADIADTDDPSSLPGIDVLEDRVQKLIRERNNIGPVNLRAEAEMEEVTTRITNMETERDDLLAAISKLRAAISQLNREGRERLVKSFTEVNQHFKTLFNKLFGGGTAELQLTDADDPLEAGLEILASPPGKRLQSLSLLSGGEQALTALAIIFAVFLTNPAPICILDEVDAPLDDSNVVRFCDLLRDICSQTDTRFLIVTHHRMTMARMDRLFGITMEQRGISKLVSVDLQSAEKIRDIAVA